MSADTEAKTIVLVQRKSNHLHQLTQSVPVSCVDIERITMEWNARRGSCLKLIDASFVHVRATSSINELNSVSVLIET